MKRHEAQDYAEQEKLVASTLHVSKFVVRETVIRSMQYILQESL